VGVFEKVYKSDEWQDYMKKKGMVPGWLTGPELTSYFVTELDAHRTLLRNAGEIE
jgi:tripartite-type tricarboxylate transporter receptor subunit TctC